MNVDTFRRWVDAFNKIPWPLRYVAIVVAVYIPGILASLAAGTFRDVGIRESDYYFITDYIFHYSWLFVVPASLLILPSVYRNMDAALKELKELRDCTPAIEDDNLTESTIMRKWGNHSIQFLIGTALGIALVIFAGIMMRRSIATHDRTNLNWWFIAEGSYGAFVYFYTLSFIVASISIIFLIRYMYTIAMLRKVTLRIRKLPTWVSSSEGSLDALFRSVFLLCVPGSTVSVVIVIRRIILNLSDFTMWFNLIMIPLAFTVGLIFPIIYCGIPRKLSSQRSKLLWTLDKKIAELMRSISEQSQGCDDKGLLEDLETAIKQRVLIKRNYPTLPIGSITKMISTIPIGISAAPPLIAAVKIAIISFAK